MRSRLWSEHAALVLGAVVEGVWCGALAAALTGASWAALTLFAAAVLLGGALIALRLVRAGQSLAGGPAVAAVAGSSVTESASGDGGVRAARVLAAGLVVCATGALLVVGRAWAHPSLLWQTARDLVFAAGLVAVGAYLGRAAQAPDVAVRRAVRAFTLLCIVLVAAALAGPEPGWASAAVVVSLAAGGLLVAVARYRDLIGLVDPAERMPAWPWLLAVAGALLIVVALGALLSLAFRVDAVLAVLHALGGVMRYLLDVVAYAVGFAGAALSRAVSWVLGLLHVRPWQGKWSPPLKLKPPVMSLNSGRNYRFPSAGKLVGTIAGAVLVIGGLLALIVLSLRRLRRESPVQATVVEEREELSSLRSAAGQFAGQLGRRLRRRVGGLFGRESDTPAERVRRRYAELERRLTKAGRPRPPGVTVRDHLADVAAAPAEHALGTPAAAGAAATEGPAPPPRDVAAAREAPSRSESAFSLAGIYELARYSAHSVDTSQVRRFETEVRVFERRDRSRPLNDTA